jgi:hypothetical protein
MTDQPHPTAIRGLVESLERDIVNVDALHDEVSQLPVPDWSATVQGLSEPPD